MNYKCKGPKGRVECSRAIVDFHQRAFAMGGCRAPMRRSMAPGLEVEGGGWSHVG